MPGSRLKTSGGRPYFAQFQDGHTLRNSETAHTVRNSDEICRSFEDSISMQVVGEKIPGVDALETFCGQDERQREFTGELRNILEVMAMTGKYWHDWSQLKSLLCFRLTQVMQEYHDYHMHVEDSTADLVHGERFSDLLDRLLQGLDSFTLGAPFTSQRLCELLLSPKDTYVSLDKLSLAFEKLLLVTSTEPPSTDPYPSLLQSSTKDTEPLQEVQVADERLPKAFIINGLHEENGRHKDIQDDEMVDVEGVADQPLGVEVDQPADFEGFTVSSDTDQKVGPEEPANGHIVNSGVEAVEDIPLSDTIPE